MVLVSCPDHKMGKSFVKSSWLISAIVRPLECAGIYLLRRSFCVRVLSCMAKSLSLPLALRIGRIAWQRFGPGLQG